MRPTHFFERVPLRAALVFFAAIFFVFAPVNVLLTSSFDRSGALGAYVLLAVLSGASAVCWAAAFTVSRWFTLGIVGLTVPLMMLSGPLAEPVLGVRPSPPSLPGLAVVGAIVLGYVLFIVFINGQGRTTLRLLTEMALAQRIHASLVPALLHSDERLEVDGTSFASTEMGGDLVDLVDHGATTDLVLADVSGHGVQAGVVMGMVKSATRMGLREDRDLSRLAGDLNDVLDQTTSPEMYATLVLLRLHHAERRLECLLAGHAPVLHHRRGEGSAARVGEIGVPVGLLGGSTYATVSVAVSPGDLLATWTDGLDETMNAADQELGREAIERAIVARAEGPLAEIRSAVFELARAHGPQRDDRSLLLVRVLG
jgi:hypothetical protein